MKKIIILIIMLIPINVFALAENAKSSILIEYDTGKVLFEKDSNLELPMASMTKMMTLYILMNKLDSGNVHLEDEVLISKNAANMGGSQVYLEEGSKVKLETLLKSVAVASANDAAVAIAEYISGSEQDFVKLMNETALSFDLKHTNFKNVHGLDEEGHYSSAYDMAVIAKHLLEYDDILKYSSIYEDYIMHPNGTSTWIVNTNKLINYYKGLDGLKTGYTNKSGYCITATAKRDDIRLISVVMGEENNNIRNEETIALLNYGFTNYKKDTILKKGDIVGNIQFKFSNQESTNIVLMDDVIEVVPNAENNKYNYEIKIDNTNVPVNKGNVVGTLLFYKNDNFVRSYNLTVENDVKKGSILTLFRRNINKFLVGIV